jgi:hypothetical protein
MEPFTPKSEPFAQKMELNAPKSELRILLTAANKEEALKLFSKTPTGV